MKSNGSSSIYLTALCAGVQHLCIFKIVARLIYHLFPNVWKASYTICASIFVDVPYCPSLVLYRVPRSGSFTFAKRFPAAQEVRESSGVAPCIVMKNDRILYQQVSSFSPESMRLRSLQPPRVQTS